MSSMRVKNGTPVGNDSLCHSCTHSLILKGYSETEEMVFCTFAFEQPMKVPFKIYKCTGYCDKNMPSRKQMEYMAIDVTPGRTLKPVGFYYPEEELLIDVPAEASTE